MALDRLVAQKLSATMQQGNRGLYKRIEEISSKPRILDGPPEKYSVGRMEPGSMEPFGIYKDYRTLYMQIHAMAEPKDGILYVGDKEIKCSYKTLVALKTLLFCGCSKSQSRANACKIVFDLAVSSIKNGELTDKDMCTCSDKVSGHFVEELNRAIYDCVPTEKEKIEWYVQEHSIGEKSRNKFLEFSTLWDLLDYIDETYKTLKNKKRGVSKVDAVAAYLETV